MTILNCPKCGGTHYGSVECPYISAPCVICGKETILACADCGIDSAGKVTVHICGNVACMRQHEVAVHGR